MKNFDYTTEFKLKHDELPAKINAGTGEVTELKKRGNNFPEGKSKLDYKEFGILNTRASKVLERHLSNLELAIVHKMINRVEFKTNSLQPLNNTTSIRDLADEFNLSVNTVPKLFKTLYDFGVYLQLSIVEDSEESKYWVLNPNIFWRGNLKEDSLFKTFAKTDLSKLLINI